MRTGIHGSDFLSIYNVNSRIHLINIPKLTDTHERMLLQARGGLEQGWVSSCFRMLPEFVSVQDEGLILAEVSGKLKTIKWCEDHLDQTIVNFREFSTSNSAQFPTLFKVFAQFATRLTGTAPSNKLLPLHVLELRHDGYILPHIDNAAYSGNLIAGLSLQRTALLTLENPENDRDHVQFRLMPRSLYVQWYV